MSILCRKHRLGDHERDTGEDAGDAVLKRSQAGEILDAGRDCTGNGPDDGGGSTARAKTTHHEAATWINTSPSIFQHTIVEIFHIGQPCGDLPSDSHRCGKRLLGKLVERRAGHHAREKGGEAASWRQD